MLILASQSPRRRQLMEQIGLSFTVKIAVIHSDCFHVCSESTLNIINRMISDEKSFFIFNTGS